MTRSCWQRHARQCKAERPHLISVVTDVLENSLSDPDFFDDVLVDEELLSSSERLDGLNRLIVAIEQYFQYVPCISW